MIARFIIGFENTVSGVNWTVSNWGDWVNPNVARAAADDWTEKYLALMPATCQIKFAKYISNPIPGGIHTQVDFPADSFSPYIGGIIAGGVVDDTMYMLGKGSSSLSGGSSNYKFHGIDVSKFNAPNKWVHDAAVVAFQAACLLWFNQYRRVATPPWTGPGSRKRGYPVVSPPESWPVFTISQDMYTTKVGRNFSLPGVVRH